MTRLLIAVLVLSVFLPLAAAQDTDDVRFRVEVVLPQARFPVALAFAPDGRLFYTEKEDGRVRMVSADGVLQREPVIELPTDGNVELGMLGIALDPAYEDNGFIWVYHIQPNTVEPPYPVAKVVRFREENGFGSDPQTMLSVPIVTREQHHVAGNLRFDTDGFLYVSIGDMGDAAFSQDLNAMQGRIHRFAVTDEGLVAAPDNPFEDNSTYAYGLRNPFDFDFDPLSEAIIAGENGPACDDEVNLILAGGNYGWREDYPCDDANPSEARFVYPLVFYTPPEAISGVMVYDGQMFPEWRGDVFYCGWNRGLMWRMELNEGRNLMASNERFPLPNQSCSSDVEVAPDGSIYFTNYNSIYRIVRDDE